MSAFWIFAMVVTVVYIIYYAAIIAKDLARPSEQRSSSAETFVLEDTAPEPGKVVEVTDKGFSVEDGSGNVREQAITNVPARSVPQPRTLNQDPSWTPQELRSRRVEGRFSPRRRTWTSSTRRRLVSSPATP